MIFGQWLTALGGAIKHVGGAQASHAVTDEMLREMPDADPAALADSFEWSGAHFDGDPDLAALIVTDLRHRAATGARFWTGPLPSVAEQPNSAVTHC